jgi:hypothetical protein
MKTEPVTALLLGLSGGPYGATPDLSLLSKEELVSLLRADVCKC